MSRLALKVMAALKSDNGKGAKIAIGIVVGILCAGLLIIVTLMSAIAAFIPDGVVYSSEESYIYESQIYRNIETVTQEHQDRIKEKMADEKQNLIDENTIEEKTTDENGNNVSITRCNMTVTRKFNYLSLPYLISYLQHTDNLDLNTAEIDETVAREFLETIESISVKEVADAEYEIENEYWSVDQIADRYFTAYADKQEFKASCQAYAAYFGVSDAEVTTDEIKIYEIDVEENFLEIPLYLQYSGPWASVSYGGGRIAEKGCCPTCLAMILSYMKQEEILPSDIVAYTGDRYYVPGAGTSWSVFQPVADHWGVTCKNLGKNTMDLTQALSEGKPVIASMGPGTFTKGGHFIVLTGITEEGKITVNDPNDNNIKNHKDKKFDITLILREAKNFWSFEQ